MSQDFPNLFTPLRIGRTDIRNRIVSTGHDTCMTDAGLVSDRMIAYHRARAAGGVGLIVLQVASVHETACYTSQILRAHDEASVPGLRKLADALHDDGATVFGQLLHPGREIHGSDDGTATVAWSASEIPNERFHTMPRALSKPMIDDIVQGFADTAERMIRAGLDGVEVVACYQYLATQFLCEATNKRTDEYGGSFDNRMRFLREVLAAIRTAVGPEPAVGIRISAGDLDNIGLTQDEALKCCATLEAAGLLDFVSLALGSSASHGGAYHIVAPMDEAEGYSAPYGAPFKERLSVPVILTGRIVQPQTAERILTAGQADACGMTRALICDPDMPVKAQDNQAENIRACIGCNQACIGHFFQGVSISCIQNPTSGRELVEHKALASTPARVLVVGGGPAGMKAAAEAAQAGHHVTLAEAGPRLGGQVLLAQLLPGRAEFGGLITNLEHELDRDQVRVRLNTEVTPGHPLLSDADHVILATGANPNLPEMHGDPTCTVATDADILSGNVSAGKNVVISDARCDWIGVGLAEKLAAEGSHVRLFVNGPQPGAHLMGYMRDAAAGRLHAAGVQVTTYTRLFGAEGNSVFLEHTTALSPIEVENVDTLIVCAPYRPHRVLNNALLDQLSNLTEIGDCMAARTAEEAVLEGWKAVRDL